MFLFLALFLCCLSVFRSRLLFCGAVSNGRVGSRGREIKRRRRILLLYCWLSLFRRLSRLLLFCGAVLQRRNRRMRIKRIRKLRKIIKIRKIIRRGRRSRGESRLNFQRRKWRRRRRNFPTILCSRFVLFHSAVVQRRRKRGISGGNRRKSRRGREAKRF